MNILEDVIRALKEDIGSGDVTANLIPENLMVEAKIISREKMLVCGIDWVNAVFKEVDKNISLKWLVEDGSWQEKPLTLCKITGFAKNILTAERTALNFLQTLSGTATNTYLFLQQLKGSKTRLLDTRKTLPGLRKAQKYAVACAGGTNHRMGLYDAFLIKENHIKACGGLANAVVLARKANPDLLIEVEVETLDELKKAQELNVKRIMLDNFTIDLLVKAVKINEGYEAELEFSGNVTLDNIAEIAKTKVDYISVGALTKSVRAVDLSLLIMD